MMTHARRAARALLDEQVSAGLMDASFYVDTNRQLKYEFEY